MPPLWQGGGACQLLALPLPEALRESVDALHCRIGGDGLRTGPLRRLDEEEEQQRVGLHQICRSFAAR